MGLAAAQARFLQLTARKTNVEYEGQQINQQRTTLANQTANYNTQLLSLNVPTPPSSGDFSKTVYTFKDGTSATNTIDALAANSDGSYSVTYSATRTETGTAYRPTTDYGVSAVRSGTAAPYTYKVGGKTAIQVTDPETIANLQANTASYDPGNSTSAFYGVDSSGDGVSDFYISNAELTGKTWSTDTETVNKYLMGTHDVTTQAKGKAQITSDTSSGRLMNIQFYNPAGTALIGTPTALSTTTKTDDAAYEDAMNQYTYNKSQYENQMNDINAKLSIVQQQDKSLELQLRACDTEQQALSTEMDAVKKVADKNIESSFKTFG